MSVARSSSLRATLRIDLLFTMSDNMALHDIRSRSDKFRCMDEMRLAVRLRKRRLAEPKPRSGEGWWSQTESNRRPPACKAGALPTELWPRWYGPPPLTLRRDSLRKARACRAAAPKERRLVGLGRFELPTSRLSSARSNQLSYKPGSGIRCQ
jgi:hypothetical protein